MVSFSRWTHTTPIPIRFHSQLFQEYDQFVIDFVRRHNWTAGFWFLMIIRKKNAKSLTSLTQGHWLFTAIVVSVVVVKDQPSNSLNDPNRLDLFIKWTIQLLFVAQNIQNCPDWHLIDFKMIWLMNYPCWQSNFTIHLQIRGLWLNDMTIITLTSVKIVSRTKKKIL